MFCVDNDDDNIEIDVSRILELDEKNGILEIYGISEENKDLKIPKAIITEYPIYGCLSSIFDKVGFFKPDSSLSKLQLSCLLFGLANAFRIIHSQSIFFYFFDPSSIFLCDNYECKIANPGVRAFFDPSNLTSDNINIQIYLAPEIIRGEEASIFSDIYGYGSLLYQLYTKIVRFTKQNKSKQFIENILDRNRPIFPPKMPPLVKNIISQCWEDSPNDRPSSTEILKTMMRNPEFFFNISETNQFIEYQHSVLSDQMFNHIYHQNNSKGGLPPLPPSAHKHDTPSQANLARMQQQLKTNNFSFSMTRSISESSFKPKIKKIRCLSKKGNIFATKVIYLQNSLMKMNRKNFDDIKGQIFKDFINESANEIVNLFMIVVQNKYTMIDTYAELLVYFYKNANENENYLKIPNVFLDILYESLIQGETFPKDIPKIALFSWANIKKLYTDSEVVDYVRRFYKLHHHNRKKTLSVLFSWFSPQISENDEHLYNKLIKVYEEILQFPNINYAFQKFYKLLDKFKENNWQKLRGRVRDNANGGRDIGYLLRHDDIGGLKSCLKAQPRAFAKRVLPDLFSTCIFIQDKPSIIMYAAAYQAVNCFQYLNLKGATFSGKDEKYRTMSDFALMGGNLTIVRFVQNSMDSFNSALQTSTLFHNIFLFQYLLKWKDFDLEEPDKFDRRVITTAAAANNIYVLLYCLNEGIQIDSHETFGWTALHTAAERGHIKAIKLMFYCNKIDPNKTDAWGTTPLHLATDRLHTDTVRFLLSKKKVNVNQKNKNGKTPFHIAVKSGYLKMVNTFLECPRVKFQKTTKKISSCYLFGNCFASCRKNKITRNC